jgi:preprotein translocase subunit SecA
MKFLDRLFGNPNDREIARLQKVVERINALERTYEALSDDALRAKTTEFRRRLARGESLDDILVEAFAAVREASKRTIGLRHYDVQLIGGIVLHQGKIAEMKTGEGKTLVATLPLYLNGLSLNPEWVEAARRRWGKDPDRWEFVPIDDIPVGRGVHLVTPNDYLSKFGVQWMGPVYHALGMSVGVIQSAAAEPDLGSFLFDPDYPSTDDRYLNLRPVSRREAYNADITYGTNNEFGFDYLRDNLVRDLADCVQRELYYAIVDEVDNILIDEARTPLIISGPAEESSDLYRRFAEIVRRLQRDVHYEVDEKTRNVILTEEGIHKVESMLPEIGPGETLYDPKHAYMLPYLDNALRAWAVYQRDKDYIVRDGQVIIVDEFTGRLMYGRRYAEGLHQAIEAKEGVAVREEMLTYATITFQNYFRMYRKLAGMTGTAATEKEEFQKIYNMDVVVLPTHVEYRAMFGDLVAREVPVRELSEVTFAGVLNGRDDIPVTVYESRDGRRERYYKRLDLEDVIYQTEEAKFRAVVAEIEALHKAGRPVLVGTTAIETSERLSRMLKARGIPHNVLNAKYHEQEAVIIAQAGRSGAVTIATQMAGRGVDILLGGNPEGLAREWLRQEGYDLTGIRQSHWNEAVDMLRRGQNPTERFPERWAEVLAKAWADCAEDRKRVVALGGLHVLGVERHEARRIDNQLRGRSGRQGDPGSSRFYLSLEDELMRRFGADRVQGLMARAGMDDAPLEFSILSKTIESVQKRVEGYNFDLRKHVLEYDDVVNTQREVIYAQRREVLSKPDLRDQVLRMVREEIEGLLLLHCPGPDPEEWDLKALHAELRTFLPLSEKPDPRWADLSRDEILEELTALAGRTYEDLNRNLGYQVYRDMVQQDVTLALLRAGNDPLRRLIYRRVVEALGAEPDEETAALPLRHLPDDIKGKVEAAFLEAVRVFRDRQVILSAVDTLWVRHLTDLSVLQEGIGLRAYGQQNPLVAYKKEAHEMYQALLGHIRSQVARTLFLVPQMVPPPRRARPLHAFRPGVPMPAAAQPAPAARPAPGGLRPQRPVPAAAPSGKPARPAPAAAQTPSSPPPGARKLGRNDPCWCGSGKKYKNCHLRQDEEAGRVPVVATRPPQTPGPRRRR